MKVLEHVVVNEQAVESEWESNVSPYITDLNSILSLIKKIKTKKYQLRTKQ